MATSTAHECRSTDALPVDWRALAAFAPAKEDESPESQQDKSDSAPNRASDNSLLIVTTGMYCILVTLNPLMV